MIRKIVALLIAAYLLAGCNTMAGMGRDVERGGQAMQNSTIGPDAY